MGNSITINGKKIFSNASNISVMNGNLIVDGQTVDPNTIISSRQDETARGPFTGELTIVIEGTLKNLTVDKNAHVDVNGALEIVRSTSGNVNVTTQNVNEIISTSGDVSVTVSQNPNAPAKADGVSLAKDTSSSAFLPPITINKVSSTSGDVQVTAERVGKVSTTSGDVSIGGSVENVRTTSGKVSHR